MPTLDEKEEQLKEEVGNDELFDKIYWFVMADLAIRMLRSVRKNSTEGSPAYFSEENIIGILRFAAANSGDDDAIKIAALEITKR